MRQKCIRTEERDRRTRDKRRRRRTKRKKETEDIKEETKETVTKRNTDTGRDKREWTETKENIRRQKRTDRDKRE